MKHDDYEDCPRCFGHGLLVAQWAEDDGAQRLSVERCDLCAVFDCDNTAALEAVERLGGDRFLARPFRA